MERAKGLITQDPRFCAICGRGADCNHHLISGSGRKYADADKLFIPVCDECHTMGYGAIHRGAPAVKLGKMLGQAIWEYEYVLGGFAEEDRERIRSGARDQFRKRYGKSWI